MSVSRLEALPGGTSSPSISTPKWARAQRLLPFFPYLRNIHNLQFFSSEEALSGGTSSQSIPLGHNGRDPYSNNRASLNTYYGVNFVANLAASFSSECSPFLQATRTKSLEYIRNSAISDKRAESKLSVQFRKSLSFCNGKISGTLHWLLFLLTEPASFVPCNKNIDQRSLRCVQTLARFQPGLS